MNEESPSKSKFKIPPFLIVILGLLFFLLIVIILSLIFGNSNFFNALTSNVVISNIFSSENPSNTRCKVYAGQFGITEFSNCQTNDKLKCFALCAAHFECCEK